MLTYVLFYLVWKETLDKQLVSSYRSVSGHTLHLEPQYPKVVFWGWNFLIGLNRSKLKSEPIVVSL